MVLKQVRKQAGRQYRRGSIPGWRRRSIARLPSQVRYCGSSSSPSPLPPSPPPRLAPSLSPLTRVASLAPPVAALLPPRRRGTILARTGTVRRAPLRHLVWCVVWRNTHLHSDHTGKLCKRKVLCHCSDTFFCLLF